MKLDAKETSDVLTMMSLNCGTLVIRDSIVSGNTGLGIANCLYQKVLADICT